MWDKYSFFTNGPYRIRIRYTLQPCVIIEFKYRPTHIINPVIYIYSRLFSIQSLFSFRIALHVYVLSETVMLIL